MPYIVNGYNGQIVAVIDDGTIDTTSTDLQLVGRSVTDYGTAENENLVWLLQNFANNVAPPNPIIGQLWYDTYNKELFVWGQDQDWVQVASIDYVQAQKISPAFTGVPTAPTAAQGTNTTQLATTAFVQNAKNSPAFTGVPTAPTAILGTGNAQIASTEFVQQTVNNLNLTTYAPLASPTFTGTPTVPSAANGTNTTQAASTHFVNNSILNLNISSYAPLTSPGFSGIPTTPTASASTNTTQVASTAFVQAQKMGPEFTGIPSAPTAANGTSTTQIATTGFVNNAILNIDYSALANINSPNFTGTPTGPNAAPGSFSNQLATTAFVANAVGTATGSLGDARLGTTQTFTGLKYFIGGIVAGSPSAPGYASYNFYDGSGDVTDTSIYYYPAISALSVALHGNSHINMYDTHTDFNQQVRVPSAGIRFSDGSTQTTANGGVTKVIGDAGITVTPSSGTGTVTVSLSGGPQSQYVLPKATSTVLGGVKVGPGLSIDANGLISANTASGVAYLTSSQTFSGVNTFSGSTNFVANVQATQYFFNNPSSPGFTKLRWNSDYQWLELWNSGNLVGALGNASSSLGWQSVGGIQGFNTSLNGGAGVSGFYDQATPGLGIGIFAASQNTGFGGDLIQASTSRSKSASFDILQSYVGVPIGAGESIYKLAGDGNAYAAGAWNGGGADYAEYFESATGSAIPLGTTLVLDGDRVRAATESDNPEDIIGVVRPKTPGVVSSIIGNNPHQSWAGRYLTDEFGQYIMESHSIIEWTERNELGLPQRIAYESHAIPSNVTIPADAVRRTHDDNGQVYEHPKLNPAYDAERTYVPRQNRNEWILVGLVGQAPVLKGQPVHPDWRRMRGVGDQVDLYFIR